MIHRDILFETDRFNVSEVKEHFINPCCFGEDLAEWLRQELIKREITASAPAKRTGAGIFSLSEAPNAISWVLVDIVKKERLARTMVNGGSW